MKDIIKFAKENPKKFLKLATKNPKLKDQLIQAIKNAGFSTSDTGAFALWAKLSNRKGMTENDVLKYLSKKGIRVKPKGEKRSKKKGPLEINEVVKVDPYNCVSKENKQNCAELKFSKDEPQFCLVQNIERPENVKDTCTVTLQKINNVTGKVEPQKYEFKAIDPVRCKKYYTAISKAEKKADLQLIEKSYLDLRNYCLTPNSSLGIYRASFRDLASYQKSLTAPPPQKFILVYKAGKPTRDPEPSMRKDFSDRIREEKMLDTSTSGTLPDLPNLEAYMETYYEGIITGAGYKSGDETFYFTLMVNNKWLSVNVDLGNVYFIGTPSELPNENDWKRDLLERLEDL